MAVVLTETGKNHLYYFSLDNLSTGTVMPLGIYLILKEISKNKLTNKTNKKLILKLKLIHNLL